jgi:CheY-like chemotaxis protein
MNDILAVCTDLFFAVKIGDAARRTGRRAKFVKSRESMLEAARAGAAMIILDLNCRDVDCTGLVRALKADPATEAIPQTAFVAHVESGVIREARNAGCEHVLARSAFVKELDAILSSTKQPGSTSLPSRDARGPEVR